MKASLKPRKEKQYVVIPVSFWIWIGTFLGLVVFMIWFAVWCDASTLPSVRGGI